MEAIGQQDPNLLAAIHANHDAFVAMMNEPINDRPAAPAAAPAAPQAFPGMGGVIPGLPPGGPNPVYDHIILLLI